MVELKQGGEVSKTSPPKNHPAVTASAGGGASCLASTWRLPFVCCLCFRKFPTVEALGRHADRSALHRRNLETAAAEAATEEATSGQDYGPSTKKQKRSLEPFRVTPERSVKRDEERVRIARRVSRGDQNQAGSGSNTNSDGPPQRKSPYLTVGNKIDPNCQAERRKLPPAVRSDIKAIIGIVERLKNASEWGVLASSTKRESSMGKRTVAAASKLWRERTSQIETIALAMLSDVGAADQASNEEGCTNGVAQLKEGQAGSILTTAASYNATTGQHIAVKPKAVVPSISEAGVRRSRALRLRVVNSEQGSLVADAASTSGPDVVGKTITDTEGMQVESIESELVVPSTNAGTKRRRSVRPRSPKPDRLSLGDTVTEKSDDCVGGVETEAGDNFNKYDTSSEEESSAASSDEWSDLDSAPSEDNGEDSDYTEGSDHHERRNTVLCKRGGKERKTLDRAAVEGSAKPKRKRGKKARSEVGRNASERLLPRTEAAGFPSHSDKGDDNDDRPSFVDGDWDLVEDSQQREALKERVRKRRRELCAAATAAGGNAGRHSGGKVIIAGGARPEWGRAYAALLNYIAVFGHTRVPKVTGGGNYSKLGTWVCRQKTLRKKFDKGQCTSQLNETKIELLNAVDFRWDTIRPWVGRWDAMYEKMRQYAVKYGHCRVPKKNLGGDSESTSSYDQLANWGMRQRKANQLLSLTKKRIQLLNQIGFEWKIEKKKEDEWNTKFERLCMYKKQTGHTRVNYRDTSENYNLGQWVAKQRTEKRKFDAGINPHYITAERIQKLNGIEFDWNVSLRSVRNDWDQMWAGNFEQLRKYQARNGHTRVPSNKGTASYQVIKLGRWATKQRKDFRDLWLGKSQLMTQERLDKLELLNFEFIIPMHSPSFGKSFGKWEDMYSALCQYSKEHGHSRTPYTSNLGKWVALQRYQRNRKERGKESILSDSRIKKLDRLDFEWSEPKEGGC